ncbi:hypothetical protein E2C01_043474 [Portunus trituberculatus]|uniref:Uncharacterized protein n=1 Tax=Portunus trituberculatus TaxID=210409 RepID=A0A5B7FZN8_PORTR|nr:hypothetical protein [Portunus trituberculatus]
MIPHYCDEAHQEHDHQVKKTQQDWRAVSSGSHGDASEADYHDVAPYIYQAMSAAGASLHETDPRILAERRRLVYSSPLAMAGLRPARSITFP